MRPKSLVLLFLALGCGLVASIGISEIIDSRGDQTGTVEMEAILVAATDIERNTVLAPENVRLEEWPKGKVPEGAVRDLAEIEGRRPVTKLVGGMPILMSTLGTGEGIVRATDEIPHGYRVVSVRVTDESSAANMIRPGDRVDVQVFVRRNPGLNIQQTGIKTFLQDVSVFAVNSEIRSDVDDEEPIQARTISLLVTPKQAAKVTLASQVGQIRLVMRGVQDDVASDDNNADIADILDGNSEKSGEPATASTEEGMKASMLSWLEEQKKAMQGSMQATAAAGPTDNADGLWRMIVHRGPDVSVEEFQPGQLLPVGSSAGLAAPATLAPTAAPSAAPAAGQPPAAAPNDQNNYQWPDEAGDAGDAVDAAADSGQGDSGQGDSAGDPVSQPSQLEGLLDKIKGLNLGD